AASNHNNIARSHRCPFDSRSSRRQLEKPLLIVGSPADVLRKTRLHLKWSCHGVAVALALAAPESVTKMETALLPVLGSKVQFPSAGHRSRPQTWFGRISAAICR